MVKIAIQGINGRMGHVLVETISAREDCTVVAGIDVTPAPGAPWPMFSSVAELAGLAEQPDVLIDFSNAEAAVAAVEYSAKTGLACVICTTGLNDADKAALQKAAEKTAVFFSANMSLGINLLIQLAKRAQQALPGFDIEIVEKHHHHKLDAPSGTALMLADAINEQGGGQYTYVYDRHAVRKARDKHELGIHAVRGGSIVGQHEVIFAGLDEVITLEHTAYSRDIFANGAVAAALYLAAGHAPGLYDMQTMMEDV